MAKATRKHTKKTVRMVSYIPAIAELPMLLLPKKKHPKIYLDLPI